MHKILLE